MMLESLQLVGLLASVFAVSMGISYALTAHRRRPLASLPLQPSTSIRIVGPGGAYRAHFLGIEKSGVRVSSPLQKDRFVPFRPGDSLMVQAPVDGSIVTFRTTVLKRQKEDHSYLLAHPDRVRHIDRRAEPRDESWDGTTVRLNQGVALLKNLSACGACLVSVEPLVPGDTVRLDLPDGFGTAHGWILETKADALDGKSARQARIRFDAPLSGMKTAARTRHYKAASQKTPSQK